MADAHSDAVGPVLEASALGRAVAAAIAERHPDARILDQGAYLRVQVRGRCVLARSAVESRLGRSFVLPGDLEALMPAFRGRLDIGDDEVVWTAGSQR